MQQVHNSELFGDTHPYKCPMIKSVCGTVFRNEPTLRMVHVVEGWFPKGCGVVSCSTSSLSCRYG